MITQLSRRAWRALHRIRDTTRAEVAGDAGLDVGQPGGWIAERVRGRTFMDVGGGWEPAAQRVSAALAGGARTATRAAAAPIDDPSWQAFDAWCTGHDVHGCGRAVLDLAEPPDDCTALAHDVVHCAGVLQHLPDPYRALTSLGRVTRDTLVVTGMVVPARVENAAGTLEFSSDRGVFVPSLAATTRAVMAAHFDALGLIVAGVNAPMDGCGAWRWPDGAPNRGPWWWLMSPAYLRGLIAAAGFEVVDGCWTWEQRAYSVLARVPR